MVPASDTSSSPPWTGSRRKLRVVLLGPGDKSQVRREAQRIRVTIEKRADIVLEDFAGASNLGTVQADLAVVMGGDGSILRTAHRMGHNQIPVLGVNLGKLGFLAELQPEEFLKVWGDVSDGRCTIVEHLMFQCRVLRGKKAVIEERLGLNETAVLGGPPYSILEIDLYVDGELVTTYSCDGLIVSTPVGSTAHNLSAGGPILRKDLQAFVVSPISPHTLTVRPVVDAADRVYEMVVRDPMGAASVVVDGRTVCSLTRKDRVRVERAEPRFRLIEVPGHGYYETLTEKLGWSGRISYKEQRR
jgi:NAD+ kinase